MRPFDLLLAVLEQIADPRRAEGKLYKLPHVLLFSILAVVTGGNSFRAIETFIKVHRRQLAQLTGSFTYIDRRFMKERPDVSITAKVWPSLPLPDRLRSARRAGGADLSIVLVTRHGISSSDTRTTTPRRSRRDPRRAIRGL